jgi:serine/threonine protein kinase
MEFVKGKSLLAMVKEEGRIENPQATQFILQAANGLAAAHDKGFSTATSSRPTCSWTRAGSSRSRTLGSCSLRKRPRG